MYEAKILEYLITTWDAVSGMATVIPGGLSQERTFSTSKPYARVQITPDKIQYISDQNRQSSYTVLIEVYADNPSATVQENIDTKLEAFLVGIVPGTTLTTGKIIYAWRIAPGGQGLQTDDERRAGVDVTVQRIALRFRVQWY